MVLVVFCWFFWISFELVLLWTCFVLMVCCFLKGIIVVYLFALVLDLVFWLVLAFWVGLLFCFDCMVCLVLL